MQANPGAELLAKFGVRHAEDLNIDNSGMLVEKFLDLAGIDALAAANDHVLDAAYDIAITLLVQGGEIAGMHPTRFVDRLTGARLVGPVAAHHGISAGQQFAGDAWRHDAALAVDDLHLQMGLDAPDGGDAPRDGIVGGTLKADGAGLGHAIGDGYLAHMHFLDAAFHDLDGAGAARHDAGTQTR